ncbi:MAG: carbon storage regulator [Planctomycetes bacterium]|nr:carbon storage regulator [Planctomycetota bacterium]
MLVLTRKNSEMIQIGNNIVIKVVELGSRWVKIGIEAPDDVRILRAELFGTPTSDHPLEAFLKQRRREKQAEIESHLSRESLADRSPRFGRPLTAVTGQTPAT